MQYVSQLRQNMIKKRCNLIDADTNQYSIY